MFLKVLLLVASIYGSLSCGILLGASTDITGTKGPCRSYVTGGVKRGDMAGTMWISQRAAKCSHYEQLTATCEACSVRKPRIHRSIGFEPSEPGTTFATNGSPGLTTRSDRTRGIDPLGLKLLNHLYNDSEL